MVENPYQSPAELDEFQNGRTWIGGSAATLLTSGLLHRKVLVHQPVEVTIEYFARGIRDRILVDGKTAVARVPILWLTKRFDFTLDVDRGQVPVSVRLATQRGTLRMLFFEIVINDVVVYQEHNGQPTS